MELGLVSFAEVGGATTAQIRLRDLLEEIALADERGLDVFGIGEHHRPDYAVSAPDVVLAAAAARTSRIRLSSAVTVLSSDDPVRVFQRFATLDLVSGGRAEVMAGRGSFIESFPLFGLDLDDYDELFATKLERLLRVRAGEPVNGMPVLPRPVQDPLPVWIAVGGTPESVARAGVLGLPLALAIIGGQPRRFAPLVELHREAARRRGHGPLPVAINVHGYVAETSQRAADEFWPSYAETMSRIGRERGWPPLTREQYEAGRGPEGHLFVGSPQEVTEKVLRLHARFGQDRFLMQFPVGPMPHEQVLRSIELFATDVAPAVRQATAGSGQPSPGRAIT